MAKTKKAQLEAAFKHGTSIGEHGETLYDAPVEIRDKADLANYGISDADCRYIHFGKSERMRVFFFKTTDKAFAKAQWDYLNTQHSSSYFASGSPYGNYGTVIDKRCIAKAHEAVEGAAVSC